MSLRQHVCPCVQVGRYQKFDRIIATAPSSNPVPGTCKWLKHMLKPIVVIFRLVKVVLVHRSNISKIRREKFEEIPNN